MRVCWAIACKAAVQTSADLKMSAQVGSGACKVATAHAVCAVWSSHHRLRPAGQFELCFPLRPDQTHGA